MIEDLDALAGSIAAAHCLDGDTADKLLLVTASVDRVSVQRQHADIDRDMELSGHVSYVGRSSLEISMRAQSAGAAHHWIAARFTFVCRDRATDKAVAVPRLLVETEEEKARWAGGERRAAAKKALRQRVKDGVPVEVPPELLGLEDFIADPAAKARELLAAAQPLLRMPAIADGDAILMRHTRASNALIAQPQQRNTAGRIFGGFLMRRAYELGFACAYMNAGERPHFVEVDEVVFTHPVEVGSLLQLESRLLYTKMFANQPHLHVEVTCHIVNPEGRSSVRSNTFCFTFALNEGSTVRRVLPGTRSEAARMVERMNADVVQSAMDNHYGDGATPYVWAS